MKNPSNQPSPATDLAELLAAAGDGSRQRKRRLVAAGAVLVIAATALLLAGRGGPQAVRFETTEIVVSDLEVTITATGNLKGLNTVEVGAEVSGRLLEVAADHNASVEKGDLLAKIDPEQYQAAVDEANARVASAQAHVVQAAASRDEAAAKLRRGEAQDREGLIARQDLETLRAASQRADAALSSARADAQLSRANLASARSRLDKTEIRAPIAGVVLSRLVEPGQTVTAGFQTPVLFKVAQDLTSMQLHASVDESDVGRVRAGQKARFTVDAWPDRIFEAEVVAVRNEPLSTETVVSYETILAVDNAEGLLRPGMTATATVVVDRREKALVVPNAALRFSPPVAPMRRGLPLPGLGGGRGGGARPAGARPGPAGQRIWVDSPEGPKPRQVRVLASDGQQSEIEGKGIAAGLQVIVDLAEEPR